MTLNRVSALQEVDVLEVLFVVFYVTVPLLVAFYGWRTVRRDYERRG
jgi:hypothetical protein